MKDYILGGILVTLFTTFILFFNRVDQRVFIKKDLTLSTDTVTADNCRFYYNGVDSTLKDIRLSIHRDKVSKPYLEYKLEPNDYVDINFKQGYNIVHISQLGQYPLKSNRIKIIKFEEKK
jgi:hypothetical protein